jgi:hypothetical protein
MNATRNNLETSNLTKICSACLLFTALLLNQTAVGPLSSNHFHHCPVVSICSPLMAAFVTHLLVVGVEASRHWQSTFHQFHCKWSVIKVVTALGIVTLQRRHVPCFNMRHVMF